MTYNKPQNGFALLMSLIVVSVVVSIGLTILDLTLKQLSLSTNSKDSESAFHAANAGLECARYWREKASSTMEVGGDISPACFGVPLTEAVSVVPATLGNAYLYEMEANWTDSSRCSEMSTLVIVSDYVSTTTVSGMEALVDGYPSGDVKECAPGALCTVISIRGYSRGCSQISVAGTVQREVLLEL